MRLNLLRLIAAISCFFFFNGYLKAQNCIPTNINGTVINLACNQVCSNLNFQIPHIKGTGAYSVNTIAYNPFPYTVPTSHELIPIYADDNFSPVIDMPFNFCFYDIVFNQCVAGSNGLLTFDIANAAPCGNSFNQSQLIPYASNNICSNNAAYYPKASIMGIFTDLLPVAASCPPDRKIAWHIEGTAPCRKFVLNYYHVGMYGNGDWSFGGINCNSLNPTTFQIVLYESTGLIDVNIERKTCNATFGTGANAILGIQDWTRLRGLAAPGKNATIWNESNKAYRFTPSGAGSRYVKSELFDLGGTLIATADTTTTVTGLLDLSFPNVCPPPGSNQYEVRTTFSSCSDLRTMLTSSDIITVNRTNSLNATGSTINTACGAPSGAITINVPAGAGIAPYTFILDPGPGQIAQAGASPMIFNNIGAGLHTVVVTDASGGCTSTVNLTVNQTNNLSANVTPDATTCPGINNGRILVAPFNGIAPFTFVLNPGNLVRTGPAASYTGLASGLYTITINDAGGCTTTPPINTIVGAGAGLSANTLPIATTCAGATNGRITVIPTNGAGLYTFLLDGTISQTGATATTFSGLAPGNHIIAITDVNGCTANPLLTATIAAGPVLTTTASHTDVLCNGTFTGSINVAIPTAGTAPYQYSLNNINWQSSNIFSGLIAGPYTVYYRESNGCQNFLTATITEPATLTATAAAVPVICNAQNNGIITVTAGAGVSPYEYSINGGTNWQSSSTFNVPAGSYTISIRDNNNCITTRSVIVTEPAALTALSVNTNASCDGGNDGIINITAAGGNPGYQYSIDGTTFQASNIFNVAPGTYPITVKDNLGCTYPFTTVVGLTNNLTYTPQTDPVICESKSVQLQLISNATQYNWTPAAGLSDTTISNPVANPIVTTSYTVTATLGRCSANDIVIVNVNTAPIPDAGPPGFICYGQTYQLQGSGGVNNKYTWTPSDYLDNTTVSNPVSAAAKTITYTLAKVIDANGCSSLTTDDVTVDVTPPIKVQTFPFDTIGYPGDKFQLLAVPSEPAVINYSWLPAIGLSIPGIANPVVTVGNIGDDVVYQVTASTIAGCKGESYVRLRVYKGPDLYAPNAFTPNDDGKNDKFYPFPVGIKSISYFRVFNRWGQLLFSSTRLLEGWDGKSKDVEQPMGTYVWMAQGITADNRVITKQGTITLIR